MRKHLIFILIGAGLTACSSSSEIYVDSQSIELTSEYNSSNKIDSIVEPYKVDMEKEMEVVIATATESFTKGRPNGSLNNWSADAVHQSQTRNIKLEYPAFTLLNVGGLRNPLNIGRITLADIYRLMPFDNEIVWVEMPISSLVEIENYIKKTGGEPISGAKFMNGKLHLHGVNENTEKFIVITSDYLFNGGDKMDFFKSNLDYNLTGVLIREAMIEEAKIQGNLIWNNQERIDFNE